MIHVCEVLGPLGQSDLAGGGSPLSFSWLGIQAAHWWMGALLWIMGAICWPSRCLAGLAGLALFSAKELNCDIPHAEASALVVFDSAFELLAFALGWLTLHFVARRHRKKQ